MEWGRGGGGRTGIDNNQRKQAFTICNNFWNILKRAKTCTVQYNPNTGRVESKSRTITCTVHIAKYNVPYCNFSHLHMHPLWLNMMFYFTLRWSDGFKSLGLVKSLDRRNSSSPRDELPYSTNSVPYRIFKRPIEPKLATSGCDTCMSLLVWFSVSCPLR